MHEIVTLQFGQQANYLGTHFWNAQESYFTYAGQEESPVDHDISFRAGIGADGSDTYTPRTLIYDLKGAFGTLRRENALYELQQHENPAPQGPWSGRTASLQLQPAAPSSYQQALDQGTTPPQLTTDVVRFWSDYNHLFYHPRSIVQLNEYELNSSLMPFERWQTGEDLFADLDREHDLLDRDLRPFLEECDQLQALQVFASIDDAWGGFTTRYLERISDDLGKGCRWVFGLKDGKHSSRERQMLQFTNLAHSLYGLDSSVSVHIPITSVPLSITTYVDLETSSPWHTSALQATAVESITLPGRLRSSESGRATFEQIESILDNDGNRRIAATAMSVEDPARLEEQLLDRSQHDTRMTNGLDAEDEDDEDAFLDINLFPSMTSGLDGRSRRLGLRPHKFSKVESLRGPWKTQDEIQFMNSGARDRFSDGPRINIHQSQLLLPVLPSFPPIFEFSNHPEKLAVKAVISTDTAVAEQIRQLEASAGRLVGVDEREALCDGLIHIAEEYEEGWSGSDESGDDE